MHQNWKMHIFFTFLFKKKKNNFVIFISQRTYLYLDVYVQMLKIEGSCAGY